MADLVPLPKLRINEEVTYLKCKAVIVGCWWDEGDQWRYRVTIARGKNRGEWMVSESTLLQGIK